MNDGWMDYLGRIEGGVVQSIVPHSRKQVDPPDLSCHDVGT